MKLCENCLDDVEPSARPFPVGWERGSQRDPFDVTLDLCAACIDTLGGPANGAGSIDLGAFHARWAAQRTVAR